jgi:hypothetical protein
MAAVVVTMAAAVAAHPILEGLLPGALQEHKEQVMGMPQ